MDTEHSCYLNIATPHSLIILVLDIHDRSVIPVLDLSSSMFFVVVPLSFIEFNVATLIGFLSFAMPISIFPSSIIDNSSLFPSPLSMKFPFLEVTLVSERTSLLVPFPFQLFVHKSAFSDASDRVDHPSFLENPIFEGTLQNLFVWLNPDALTV